MPFSRQAFSGFPFEQRDRDDDFRSQLDDIAKRHPEFAEHFEGFPFRSETLGRNRRPPRPSEQEFRRFTDRPFGSSRFERFGFPFTSDPFDEEREPKAEPQQSEGPPQPKPEETEEKPKERGRKQNIQPSNTVDLGQKQEPVNDRNQRSMSAPPPDNRQRYVSSIHIPINRDGGMGEMGKAQSQQQPQEKPASKPTERVIPIHVEGRDEPVMPKHSGPSFSQPQSQPQPERIFGQSPSHFTQFVGRESPRQQYAAGPEWHHPGYGPEVRQQQKFQQAAPPQQQKFQQQAPPPQQKFQQQEIPVQKPQEQVPPQPQAPKSNNPIDLIQSIQKDVSELMGQVEKFAGAPRDKQYLYLDEMLTRNLLKLDNIDTQGQENIRLARKEAIKCIQSCINILEAKAAANVAPPAEIATSEPENKPEEKVEENKETMEVEGKQQESVEKVEPPKQEVEAPKEENMEVASNPVEDKMEVTEPVLQEPKQEEVCTKPDEEMKKAAPTESTETNKEDEAKNKVQK